MSAQQIPLPRPTPISKPFWEACKQGRLMVQQCGDCGAYTFIPQPCCGACTSENLEWVESSGRGTLYSFSTVYRPQQPVFETPYTVVVVEMEEGYHMLEPDRRRAGGRRDRRAPRSVLRGEVGRNHAALFPGSR